MAELNRLIAAGGTQNVSPVQRYYQAKEQAQREQMNALAMQQTKQAIQTQTREGQMKSMASLAQYLDSVPEHQRETAFQQAIPKMASMGLPQPPAGTTYESAKGKLEQAKIQVHGSPKAPTVQKFGGEDIMYRDGAEVARTPTADKGADSSKWMRVAELSRMIESGKGTPGDKAEFEALTKPSVAVSVAAPTKNVTRIADDVMEVLEVDKDKIKGEIENEDAYRTALSTKAQTMQAVSEKAGNPISLEEAMRQAHDDMVASGKLKDAKGMEIFGMTPFSKKWVYDPSEEAVSSPEIQGQPSDLQEGETGVFGGFEYKREGGKLQRRKVE